MCRIGENIFKLCNYAIKRQTQILKVEERFENKPISKSPMKYPISMIMEIWIKLTMTCYFKPISMPTLKKK